MPRFRHPLEAEGAEGRMVFHKPVHLGETFMNQPEKRVPVSEFCWRPPGPVHSVRVMYK